MLNTTITDNILPIERTPKAEGNVGCGEGVERWRQGGRGGMGERIEGKERW